MTFFFFKVWVKYFDLRDFSMSFNFIDEPKKGGHTHELSPIILLVYNPGILCHRVEDSGPVLEEGGGMVELNDPSLVHDHYPVAVQHCAQPVSDGQH